MMATLRLILLGVLVRSSGATLANDPDYPKYERFLRKFRPAQAERRRMNSNSAERFAIFKRALRDLETQRKRDPNARYSINAFSDLSEAEFLAQWTGHTQNVSAHSRVHAHADDINATHRRRAQGQATTIDWRFNQGGRVTLVKNQGGCGSCWAFAAIQQLESDHAIANGHLLVLSAQQLTSCTYAPSRNGCNGGRAEQAITAAIQRGGIMLESEYPYTGRSPPCAFSAERSVTRPVSMWSSSGSETPMIERIFTSPITVAIDAGAYRFYSGGVMGCNAGGRNVNHAVQAVGYNGEQPGQEYWCEGSVALNAFTP